jgi:hypothetical protein
MKTLKEHERKYSISFPENFLLHFSLKFIVLLYIFRKICHFFVHFPQDDFQNIISMR